MKFKVGDKVMVLEKHSNFYSQKGKVVPNESTSCDYTVRFKCGGTMYYNEGAIKLIKPKLTEKRIREIIQEELNKPEKNIDVTGLCNKVKWNYGTDFAINPSVNLKPKPLTIAGYEMKQEGNQIKFGCMSFTITRVRSLLKQCESLGLSGIWLRDTEYNSHNITTNQLKEIVKQIK